MREQTHALDHDGLRHLTGVQDGVVSRRQVLELGGSDHDLARMLRRRELVRLHPGVFVDHTGPPSRAQRAWGGVLLHWPAVLTHEWALPATMGCATGPVQVAIDLRRSVRPVPGVRARRTAGLDERADWLRSPPKMRLEHAALDVAAGLPQTARAFQLLAQVCQTRQTTPARIRSALATRRGLPHGALFGDLLVDLGAGACSVLERDYLHRVERPHGLPAASRQGRAASAGRIVYRDALHAAHALVVELDGRAFHDDPVSRDADAERDLVAAVESDLQSVRLTYGQVLDHPCRTAARIAALLERRGWLGPFRACPRCPSALDS